MNIYCQNFLYTQDLYKLANDKRVKPQNYALSKKVWLNSKYIKSKQNQKFETKFLGFFEYYIKEKNKFTNWNY